MCWGGRFFAGICFGNITCTLGGDSIKLLVFGFTLGGGTVCVIGSGVTVSLSLVSVGDWVTSVGCTDGGRNGGKGMLCKKGCFTL